MSLPEGPQRPEVTIGSRAGDHLTIRSVARAPRPSEPGWFRVEVEISADPFSGRYEAFWYAEFIRRFVAELSSAYERLGGTTELKPAWEDSLWLRFKID